MNPKP